MEGPLLFNHPVGALLILAMAITPLMTGTWEDHPMTDLSV